MIFQAVPKLPPRALYIAHSTEGDGTVPLSSQSVYSANPNLGGNNLGTFDVVDGSHGGANAVVDKLETMRHIVTIQGRMKVPTSNNPNP
jgi:hypothetical protein